ncbi:hypothetical protein [Neobacillus drentensis]|uniref:YqgU-like beta propeller domain-containing protein n=1 Tax=Neobacillus drentensis TaxID=220684 RepID=UPI002FFFA1E3
MNKSNYPTFLVLYLLSVILILGACSQKEQVEKEAPINKEKLKSRDISELKQWKLPISIPEGEFSQLAGWISGNQVLFTTNLEKTSNVYRYDFVTGKSEVIYKSEYPIVKVRIAPSRKHILIHASKSSTEGLVTIIDTSGTVLLTKSFPSYELEVEWNPYNDSELLVSTFAEDWSFKGLLLDVQNAKITELTLAQPFNKWIDNDKIAFIDWDEENPSFFAPLIERNLENANEKTLLPAVIDFSVFPDLLMTISVNEQNQSLSSYSFFNKKMNQQFSFSMPQLTKYSDWLIPFYDYNERRNQFITFSPLSSGEVDSYTDGFQLLAYNLKKGTSTLIMDGLENVPISVSPTGEALLYGNRLEKMIDLGTKKIYELIKE